MVQFLFRRPCKDQVTNAGPQAYSHSVFSSPNLIHYYVTENKISGKTSCGWQSQGWFKFLGLFSGHAKEETVLERIYNPIKAMGCEQCLPLSVVQLKGKHCRKPHCCNGVVDTFEL